ncbi:MAG: hypothetical protein OQK82_03510, partial [Candidatus Pacearchaeota archaeon]|nr:hypothetical protein [Candidatus Pacearchaeota archaeon]
EKTQEQKKKKIIDSELNKVVSADDLLYILDNILQKFRIKAIKLPEALARINMVLEQVSGDYKKNYLSTKVIQNQSNGQKLICVPKNATRFENETEVFVVPIDDIVNKIDNSFLEEFIEHKAEELFLDYYERKDFIPYIQELFKSNKEKGEINALINSLRVNTNKQKSEDRNGTI